MDVKEGCDDEYISRGEEVAKAFEGSVMHVVGQVLDSVSVEEVSEMLKPLPELGAHKVKAKHDDLVLDMMSQDIHTMSSDPRFTQKLNVLKDLELKASSSIPAWRPSKMESTSDLLRPYRVKFLKEQTAKFEELIHVEQVKLERLRKLFSDFMDTSNKIRQEGHAHKKQLENIISDLERDSQALNAKLQEFRMNEMKK